MSVLPRYNSSALQLTGNAYVDAGNPTVLQNIPSFTLEAWVYPTTATGTQTVVGKTNVGVDAQYLLYLDQGVPTALYPSANPGQPNVVQAPAALSLNTWHYLAATYDATQGVLTLYVDFQQPGTAASFPASPATSAADVLIGASLVGGTPGNCFQGAIGRVLIWSSCRSAEDVLNDSVELDLLDATAAPTLELYIDFSWMPAVDMSGNNIALSFEQGAQYQVSTPGLQLGGSAWVNCGNDPVLDLPGTLPYTLEGWVFPSAAGAIVSKFQGTTWQYQLLYSGADQFVACRNADAGQIASSSAVTPGSWYHVAMSYDGTNQLLSLYVNGNLQAAELFASPVPSAAAMPLVVGANLDANGSPQNFFQGQVQNLRLWSVCLSPAEIQQWMYNDPVDTPDLLAALDFTVSPPLDLTQNSFLQLEGGAVVGTSTAAVAPGSFEGAIGNIDPSAAFYLGPADGGDVIPPAVALLFAEQPTIFSDAAREISWQHVLEALPPDADRSANLRERFEQGWREAQERVAANPELLDVFSRVEQDGMLHVIYHGLQGDVEILVVPVGAISDCTLWWIQFIYTLTAGFLQALGLLPANGAIAKSIYNVVSANPAVMTALQTLAGKTLSATASLGLIGVIYQQGLFWPILKLALTSAGWWGLTWALAQIIKVATGAAAAAAILAGFIVWAIQLTQLSLGYPTACPTGLNASNGPRLLA